MERYETYKDSGIEWLGQIPGHWEVVPMKRKFSFGKGLPITKADLVESGQPVISYGQIHSKQNPGTHIEDHLLRYVPSSLTEGHESSAVSVGDFIFADTSEDVEGCGNAVYIDRGGIYAGYHAIIAKSNRPDNKYYAYLFLTDLWRSQIRSMVFGVKVYSITKSVLSQASLIIPPLSEQEIIASYLDYKIGQVNLLIAEKEKQMKDLQQYRMSLISETVTRGLNPDVKMKESGVEWLGRIPEHWATKKIKNLLEQSNNALRVGPFGSSLSGNDFVDNGYWVYNQRVVLNNNFLENDSFITEKKYNELYSFRVTEGDILLTTRGSIGKIAIVPHDFHAGVIHPCIIRFRIDESIVNKEFLKCIFNDTELIANQVKNKSNSTTIDVIYSNTVKDLQIALPSIEEQNDIVKYLTKKKALIDTSLQTLTTQLSDLRCYKTSVITEAVTGKVDVRQWKQT